MAATRTRKNARAAAEPAEERQASPPQRVLVCGRCRQVIVPADGGRVVWVRRGLQMHGHCHEEVVAAAVAKAVRAGTHSDSPTFLCLGCRRLVGAIRHVTPDGTPLCADCSPAEERLAVREPSRLAAGEHATCGRCRLLAATRRCQGCGVAACDGCWNRHSHTTRGGDWWEHAEDGRTS